MTRYEYKREYRGKVAGTQAYSSPDVGYLNQQGKDGWMLCGLYESTPGFEVYVFKREARRKVMHAKRYLWVVENQWDEKGEWVPDSDAANNREDARYQAARDKRYGIPARVRKYVPAE